jgi:hypothetical protein
MNERNQIGIKLVASHLVLPIALILVSVLLTHDAFLSLSIAQTSLCILFLAGYWEFWGSRFRIGFCTLIEILILAVFAWKSGSNIPENISLVIGLSVIQAWLLFLLIKIILVIVKKETPSVDIEFPFKQGNYLVTDGGNSKLSRLMNYHFYSPVHKKNGTNNSMLFATDIVKVTVNKLSFLPLTNESYLVFNEKIYSPISGIVVKAENNIPDNQPFSGNYPYNTGNTVVIQKDNCFLLLGHLKQGSVAVKAGDFIRQNELIGLAGNSGYSERPHLHMQLIKSESPQYWSGKGVCIRYKNKNLYKNRLIKV